MHGTEAIARSEPALGLVDPVTTPTRVSPRRSFSAPLSQRRLREIAADLLDTLDRTATRLEHQAEQLWDVGHAEAAGSCDAAAHLARARAAHARTRLFN